MNLCPQQIAAPLAPVTAAAARAAHRPALPSSATPIKVQQSHWSLFACAVMSRPLLAPALADRLTSSGVPLSCAGCPLDLDPEADDYPPFEVDYDSQLLGTVSEFGRQVVIGTNKSDWIKEVTDLEGSLAGLLKQAWQEGTPKDSSSPGVFEARALLPPVGIEGVFKSVVRPSLDLAGLCLSEKEKVEEIPPRLSITNGSFIPSSHHGKTDSVMVFPDFTLVDVPVSEEGAETFEKHYLRDGVPRGGNHVLAEGEGSGEIEGGVRSWALPYRAVILICASLFPHCGLDSR